MRFSRKLMIYMICGMMLLQGNAAVSVMAAQTTGSGTALRNEAKASAKKVRTGWGKDGKYKVYYADNGTLVRSKLRNIKGSYYYFNKDGHMLTGTHTMGGVTYYFRNDGELMATRKNGKYYMPGGKQMSEAQKYDFTTFQTAVSLASKLTKKSMSKSEKLLTVFRWVMNKRYIRYRADSIASGWIPLYANDILKKAGGTCLSGAAAFAYLASALGYDPVYVCLSSNYDTAHAWVEIGGKVYDPLFAATRSFDENYKASYAVYSRSNPKKRIKMNWCM